MALYSVEVIWHPAFELCMSLEAYLNSRLHKVVDLGSAWRSQVKRMLPKDSAESLHALLGHYKASAIIDALQILILAWPEKSGTIEDFLQWASALNIGDLYSLAAEYIPREKGVPRDLSQQRDTAISLMQAWNNYYFKQVDALILSSLAAEAQARQNRTSLVPAIQLVEEASGGVLIKAEPAIAKIILIPQYHCLPWNIFHQLEGQVMLFYPAELNAAKPDEPPKRLLRLSGALSDPSRLRILRFVAERPRSFTDIAKYMRLTKPTVHYHLVMLRAAGLLQVETFITKTQGDMYTLRHQAITSLAHELASYLGLSTER